MMILIDYYWPVMVVALVVGMVSGVLAFRPNRQRSMTKRRNSDR